MRKCHPGQVVCFTVTAHLDLSPELKDTSEEIVQLPPPCRQPSRRQRAHSFPVTGEREFPQGTITQGVGGAKETLGGWSRSLGPKISGGTIRPGPEIAREGAFQEVKSAVSLRG